MARAAADIFKPEIFKTHWLDKVIQHQEKGTRFCFVIYWQGELAGSSSFYDLDHSAHKCLSIGFTWYHPDFWGSALNPTVKYLLLNYAFEKLGMLRVAFLWIMKIFVPAELWKNLEFTKKVFCVNI